MRFRLLKESKNERVKGEKKPSKHKSLPLEAGSSVVFSSLFRARPLGNNDCVLAGSLVAAPGGRRGGAEVLLGVARELLLRLGFLRGAGRRRRDESRQSPLGLHLLPSQRELPRRGVRRVESRRARQLGPRGFDVADDLWPGVLRGRDGKRRERGKRMMKKEQKARASKLPSWRRERIRLRGCARVLSSETLFLLERRALRDLFVRGERIAQKRATRAGQENVFACLSVTTPSKLFCFSTSTLLYFHLLTLALSPPLPITDAHGRRPLRPRPLRHHLQAVAATGKRREDEKRRKNEREGAFFSKPRDAANGEKKNI